MKDAEKAIIENLRKTTLSHLSEYDYDVVIKEIEKYGITNLTGTTDKLVREAVIKHGSHNQKTHGRSGKGRGSSFAQSGGGDNPRSQGGGGDRMTGMGGNSVWDSKGPNSLSSVVARNRNDSKVLTVSSKLDSAKESLSIERAKLQAKPESFKSGDFGSQSIEGAISNLKSGEKRLQTASNQVKGATKMKTGKGHGGAIQVAGMSMNRELQKYNDPDPIWSKLGVASQVQSALSDYENYQSAIQEGWDGK